jgi:hypothetical protein
VCTGQRVAKVPLNSAGLGPWELKIVDQDWFDQHPDTMFVSMGPVLELGEMDFDLLGASGPARWQIAPSEPLWPAFDVTLWQLSNLDDLSAVA